MFRPDQTNFYAQNAEGKPEYASILITLDSHLVRPEDAHVVQKMVLSTQSAAASLMALLTYYSEGGAASHPTTMEMMMQAGRATDPVFVYVTPREGIIEVLMAVDTFEGLSEHAAFGGGSLLLLTEKLTDVVARALADFQRSSEGGVPRVFFFDIGPAIPDEEVTKGEAGEKPEED